MEHVYHDAAYQAKQRLHEGQVCTHQNGLTKFKKAAPVPWEKRVQFQEFIIEIPLDQQNLRESRYIPIMLKETFFYFSHGTGAVLIELDSKPISESLYFDFLDSDICYQLSVSPQRLDHFR